MDGLGSAGRARLVLVGSAVVTALLYVVPYGVYLVWPLLWLSTLAHEMGHGLAAVLVGGDFESFRMWPDGSGVAAWQGSPGRLARGFVAAGGLVGPALASALGFVVARSETRARAGLLVFGIGLLFALVWVVRGWFGWVFVSALAALCLVVSWRAPLEVSRALVVFLAVQLALSVFSRGDYLFTETARTAQGPMPSDVAQMSGALFLPYWFWGLVCASVSVGVLVLGLRA